MTIKAIQYISDATQAALWLPNSNANCGVVTGIQDQGFTWGSGDNDSQFSIFDRDITAFEEVDLIMRKKAIDRIAPTGAFLDVHADDQISTDLVPE